MSATATVPSMFWPSHYRDGSEPRHAANDRDREDVIRVIDWFEGENLLGLILMLVRGDLRAQRREAEARGARERA